MVIVIHSNRFMLVEFNIIKIKFFVGMFKQNRRSNDVLGKYKLFFENINIILLSLFDCFMDNNF